MKDRLRIRSLLFPLLLLTVWASPALSQTTRPATYSDYSILLDRNIFSKTRTRPSYQSFNRTERRTRAREQRQTQILTGITKENGTYFAFIEDTRAAATTRYKIGDKLAEGVIKSVGFGSVDFDTGEGAIKRVEIGMDLEGQAANFSPYSTTQPTTEPSTPDGATPAPAGPTNDIIERMKRARLQEIKK